MTAANIAEALESFRVANRRCHRLQETIEDAQERLRRARDEAARLHTWLAQEMDPEDFNDELGYYPPTEIWNFQRGDLMPMQPVILKVPLALKERLTAEAVCRDVSLSKYLRLILTELESQATEDDFDLFTCAHRGRGIPGGVTLDPRTWKRRK